MAVKDSWQSWDVPRALQQFFFHVQGQCDASKQIPGSLTSVPNPPSQVPAGRCLIGVQYGLFRLSAPNHYFWLDSINVHAMPVAAGTENSTCGLPLQLASMVFV
jgi:hypothetical protein